MEVVVTVVYCVDIVERVLVLSFFVWMFFACCRDLMCSSSFYNHFYSMFLLSITAPWELLLGNGRVFFILSLLFLLLFLHDIFHLTIAIEVILYSCVCHWSKLCDICWANGFKACKHWKYLLGYWIFCAKFAGIEFNFFPFDVVLGPLFSLLEYAMGAYSL